MSMSRILSRSLCTLAALTLLTSGCRLEDRICTDEARASVNVIVKDASGAPLNDATVTYSVDGGPSTACDDFGDGSYACAYEVAGDFVITATGADGASASSDTITVTEDECHVNAQAITITLPAT